ncbi:MAG: haloacid dehalogenase, partial [Pseudomonadota bacterium]
MTISAILFGSIGTLVETSEHQRHAFNRAFRDSGLDWNWDQPTYRDLLAVSGGQNRIRLYAERRGDV